MRNLAKLIIGDALLLTTTCYHSLVAYIPNIPNVSSTIESRSSSVNLIPYWNNIASVILFNSSLEMRLS